MHVDIHRARKHLQEKRTDGKTLGGDIGNVGLLQRGHDGLAFDVATVDKGVLMVAVAAHVIRRADKAVHADTADLTVYRQKSACKFAAKNRV